MFSDNVNRLFFELGTSNSDIARAAGCAPSNISRLRTGARTPKKVSPTSKKLVDGIFNYAVTHKMKDHLCRIIGSAAETDVGLKHDILRWLFEGEETVPSETGDRSGSHGILSFAYKLDRVMSILDMSNVRLAKAVSLDPSQISRFRTGARVPRLNQGTAQDIADYLIERISVRGKQEDVLELINGNRNVSELKEPFDRFFKGWFCDTSGTNDEFNIEGIFNHARNLSSLSTKDNESIKELIKNSKRTKRSVYTGYSGAQEGMLRIFSEAIEKKASDIFMFTNQNVEWIYNNPSFAYKWFVLLKKCVKNGTNITVIHFMDRPIREITKHMEFWIPLYATGKVRSYLSEGGNDHLFSNCMYLIPQTAALFGMHVRKFEDSEKYIYETDKEFLTAYEEMFRNLISECSPMMEVFANDGDKMREQLVSNLTGSKRLIFIRSTLPAYLMQDEQWDHMLSRKNIDPEEKGKLTDFRKKIADIVEHSLHYNGVHDFFQFISDEDLYAGKAVLGGTPYLEKPDVSYTPEEYSASVKNIIERLDSDEKYHFYQMTGNAFDNIEVYISEKCVIFISGVPSDIMFVVTYPRMVEQFTSYVESKIERYSSSRRQERNRLLRYL